MNEKGLQGVGLKTTSIASICNVITAAATTTAVVTAYIIIVVVIVNAIVNVIVIIVITITITLITTTTTTTITTIIILTTTKSFIKPLYLLISVVFIAAQHINIVIASGLLVIVVAAYLDEKCDHQIPFKGAT